MAGDNRIVTENFLRLNFPYKYMIAPGTNDLLAMNCDQILARYMVGIIGINSSGNRLPAQNQIMTLPSGIMVAGGTIGRTFINNVNANTITQGDAAITEKGFCWKTGGNPSINDGKLNLGSGLGNITGNITGLLPNTGYTIRFYGISAYGVGYSTNALSFTTLP